MTTKIVKITSEGMAADVKELLARWNHYQATPRLIGTTGLTIAAFAARKDGVTLDRFLEAARYAYELEMAS